MHGKLAHEFARFVFVWYTASKENFSLLLLSKEFSRCGSERSVSKGVIAIRRLKLVGDVWQEERKGIQRTYRD